MIYCPMIDKGRTCKSVFQSNRDLVRHLVENHSAWDVADMVLNLLGELAGAERELEMLTIPKVEENKSEDAIP